MWRPPSGGRERPAMSPAFLFLREGRSMKRLTGLVGVLFMSFSVHAQQDALRPFVPPNAEIKLGTVLTGQLLVGRKDAWPGAPDFFCRQSNTQASLVNHPLADGT